MSRNLLKYYFCMIIVASFAHCVKPYQPPALEAKNNYLVVDGIITPGVNQVTTINLSRTRNLTDTVTTLPELNASVMIRSSGGIIYPLTETGNGVYKSLPLNLDNMKTYQIRITTSNGSKYSSDYVACQQTPPIDSLTWEQRSDVFIYLYAHDPSNSTHYYKWDYTETWQFNSQLETIYGVANHLIFLADTTNQLDSCWKSQSSVDILAGSSVNLSEDVIDHSKIATIPQNDERIGARYSILVRQRAITAEAYKYWQIVQKNSQIRGGFFDLQPGQLVGNIHCESDPTEPVIGFVNAATEQEYRIFIKHDEVTDWSIKGYDCPTIVIPQDPNDFRVYNYSDTTYVPYYFVTGGIVLSKKVCLDCSVHGGTNDRPSYW